LRLNMEAVDVNSAVLNVCETCRPFILEKGIHLHCDLPDRVYYVEADPVRLQQVLWNLVKNAAKFTPERGDIYVGVFALGDDRVRIQVRDTGMGIKPEILPRIFDAFEQGDASVTRQFGGMGLGLAISKALVDRHGGVIRAESSGPKAGSTFTVDLATVAFEQYAGAVPATRLESRDDKGNAALRVLIVEDHTDTALVLSKLLGAFGHKVKTAASAAAALALVKDEAFDVMVSDIGLPDATGYELMKEIKLRYPIKGIAMSGYGMDEDLRKSREAGFSDHVVKPANVAELERSIRRAVGRGVTDW
jgi:CheY-like chemotaxis protein